VLINKAHHFLGCKCNHKTFARFFGSFKICFGF